MDHPIIQAIKNEAAEVLDFLKKELSGIRSGRPQPALLENVKIDYFGSILPLKQMATVSVSPPNSLLISAWDKAALGAIEKSVNAANLGLSIANEGAHLRAILPPLSAETREALKKTVRQKEEQMKIEMRQKRDKRREEVKDIFEKKEIGEDEKFRLWDEIQKAVDGFNAEAKKIIEEKEKELDQ